MIDRSTIRRLRENSRRYSNNATCRSSADTAQCCVQSIKLTHTRIYSRIDRPIPKHAWVDGQFDRLLIPNSGAFDLIKVKSRHWPQWGGYPCYNDRRIIMAVSSRPKIETASGIKKTQKRNGPLKGNFIRRVLNLLAWQSECGTGRLSVPCKTKRGHRKSNTDKVIQRYVNVATYSY